MLSFFPRGVLDEILNLIESVSEGFPSYPYIIIVRMHYFTGMQNSVKYLNSAQINCSDFMMFRIPLIRPANMRNKVHYDFIRVIVSIN